MVRISSYVNVLPFCFCPSAGIDCSLPKVIGPCRGAMPRYFYSTGSGMCESFLYGGCKGNANNFETSEECTSHCGNQESSVDERKLSQRE